MILKFPTLFFCLALSTAVHATPNIAHEATVQQAIRKAEAELQWIDRTVEQQRQGQLDWPSWVKARAEIVKKTEVIADELHAVNDSDHPVVSYLLAFVESSRQTPWIERRPRICALYQAAAEQGLLAAAVATLRTCRVQPIPVDLAEPTLVRLRMQATKALAQPDPYAAFYPLPTRSSSCFKKFVGPSADLSDDFTSALLDLKQYQADTHYLLAITGAPDAPETRVHYERMQALTSTCIADRRRTANNPHENQKVR